MNHQDALDRFIPNSPCAIKTLNLALRLRGKWGTAQPMRLFVNDKLTIEGNFNAFTNPAIEAGVIHCRAMLEFISLAMRGVPALVITHLYVPLGLPAPAAQIV